MVDEEMLALSSGLGPRGRVVLIPDLLSYVASSPLLVVGQEPSSRAVSGEQNQGAGPSWLTVAEGPLLLAYPLLHMASVDLPSLTSAAQPVAPVLVACEAVTDFAGLDPLTSGASAPVGAGAGQSWPGCAVSAGLGEDYGVEGFEQ